MKLSERVISEVANTRIAAITNYNMKELEEFQRKLGVKEVSDVLRECVAALNVRFSGVRVLTCADFSERFPTVSTQGGMSVRLVLGEKNAKTGFPVLYVYAPELQTVAEAVKTKAQKVGNLKRISAYMSGERYGLQPTEEFKDFVLHVLPADLPHQLVFDGSRIRVAALAEKPGAVVYGNPNTDDVFAVVHEYRGTEMLTFFVSEHDYVTEFATQLVRHNVPEDIATQISEALPHDVYYGIAEVCGSAEEFAAKVPRLLRLKEGDTVTDILQGQVGTFDTGKILMDLDDELPSAVLIGNVVNVYVPKAK